MAYSITLAPEEFTETQKEKLLKTLPYSEEEVQEIISKLQKKDKPKGIEEEEEEEPLNIKDIIEKENPSFLDMLNYLSIDYILQLPEEELKELISVLTEEECIALMSVDETDEKLMLVREKINQFDYNSGQETELKETKEKWLQKLGSEGLKELDSEEKEKIKKKKKKQTEANSSDEEGESVPMASENFADIALEHIHEEGATCMEVDEEKQKKKKKKKINSKKMFAKKKFRELYEMVQEDSFEKLENLKENNSSYYESWNIVRENTGNDKIPTHINMKLIDDLSQPIQYNDGVYYFGNIKTDTIGFGFIFLCLLFFKIAKNKLITYQ